MDRYIDIQINRQMDRQRDKKIKSNNSRKFNKLYTKILVQNKN